MPKSTPAPMLCVMSSMPIDWSCTLAIWPVWTRAPRRVEYQLNDALPSGHVQIFVLVFDGVVGPPVQWSFMIASARVWL